jgi:hypothetical protein
MRAQATIEFLVSLSILFLVFASLFYLYTQGRGTASAYSERIFLLSAAGSLADAINNAATSFNPVPTSLTLPDGDYSLSLKYRRIQASSGKLVISVPILTDAVVMPELAGGDLIRVEAKEGKVYVTK